MRQRKNLTILLLMISSLGLLITLQFLWLHNSYEKAFFDFRRETNTLFRNTVMAMRDSLFAKNIKPISTDSIIRTFNPKIVIRDSMVMKTFNGSHRERNDVQIFISSTIDTLNKDLLKPIASNIARMRIDKKGAPSGFIVQLSPDTLNVDSLTKHFRKTLARAGIEAPFAIQHVKIATFISDHSALPSFSHEPDFLHQYELSRSKMSVYNDTVISEPVRVSPLNRYVASFSGVRRNIFEEITPQILFSVFLTLTTAAAFLLMYHNLRSQQRLMEAKNDFISNVTHELKTPVATVSVALEALKNFNAMDNPALTKEYLDIALRELKRLTLMTDTILKTSVFEDKGVNFKPAVVQLDEIIEQILDSMKLLFEKKEAKVSYQKEGKSFEVSGGEAHLTNMIYNLIDNALKYSHEKPVITISLSHSTSFVNLSVKDEGVGIPAEYHKKIFEKFFRVPTGDVHDTKGYGLGLNYVAAVVKSHGGNIKVNSSPQKGSEFIVSLPAKT